MSDVSTQNSEVLGMRSEWELIHTLLGGTRAIRTMGETYMPKWANEESEAYKARIKTATLFPAFSRTIKTLVGKPFSKPITVEPDVPAKILPWLDNIDLEGRNLDVFASDLLESALGKGLCGILVDYPKATNAKTLADERAQGLRPYWLHIKPEQILGWRNARVNGVNVLTQLRLMESTCIDDGEFADKKIDQIRVLEPKKWATYRKDDKGVWLLHEQGLTTLGYIPFVPIYGNRTGFMTSTPPLVEMAYLNVKHWQSASDQQTILHTARVPILAVIGIYDNEDWNMTVGASAAVKLPINCDMKYIEHTGSSIQAGRDSLHDLEEEMRQAGAELLLLRKQANKTATEVATDNAVGVCALQRISQGLEDAIDQALQVTADWIGEKTGGHVDIFDDYGAATLADAGAQLVLSAQQSGLISKETAINELKRRGIISSDIDALSESEKVSAESPALSAL